MTDYTKNASFAAKTGTPVLGADFDSEFDEIATSSASKEDKASKGVANGYAGLNSSGTVPSAQLIAATESAKGAVELATTAEVVTGTDTGRGVTPAGVKAAIDAFKATPSVTGALVISNTSPQHQFYESDAAADEKYWRHVTSGGNFYLQTMSDAASPASTVLTVARTGTTVDSIAWAATSMTFNGVSINSAAGLTTGTLPDARIASTGVTQHQASLTILETQITDGAVLARVGGAEVITGAWTFSAQPKYTAKGAFPYYNSATQTSGAITVSTAAASGTPAAGDLWLQYTA